MKNLAFAALCMGSLGLLACGGGGGNNNNPDSGIVIPGVDGGGGGGDAGSTAACNPSAQSGCNTGEKCTYIIEQTTPTVLGHTDCAPDGTVALGGDCTRDANGVDDCVAGTFCSGNVCTEICGTTPNTCPTNQACVPYSSLFEDVDNTGLCNPSCDVLDPTATCQSGEACYLSLFTSSATCATPYLDDAEEKTGAPTCANNPGTQDCNCIHLNGCAAGFGCVLLNAATGATGNVCTYFCDPEGAGPGCSDTAAVGAGPSFSCRQIMTFYSDAMDIDPAIGMCVNPTTWAGYCGGCVASDTSDVCNMAKCCDNDPNTNDPNCPM